MNAISGIYRITNTITGDFYIGSSKNIKSRWVSHKCPSMWNKYPNNQLYQDFQKYGLNKFDFEILEKAEVEQLKEKEQQFIEMLKPTYNNIRAKGIDVERRKKYQKEYEKTDKRRGYNKEYHKDYEKTDKYKQYQKDYEKTDKYKESHRKYNNQLCSYNGETLTLCALRERFKSQGITNPTAEAKKYLIKN